MRSLSPDARLLVFVLLCSWSTIQAQSSASIEGLVTDQNQESIAGAEITASDQAIGINRKVITDNTEALSNRRTANWKLPPRGPRSRVSSASYRTRPS